MTKPIAKIDSNAITPLQYSKGARYRLDIPFEMEVEDLIKPSAWTHIRRDQPQLGAGNIIECVKEDMSLFVELFVIGHSGDQLFVRVMREVILEESKEEKISEAHKIKFLGPVKKHTIIRVSDNEELRTGISSRAEAEQILKNHY